MTAALIPTPVMQFLDADGNPLVGGKVYTYAAGTSTPLATYTDYGGATPNANPVILNSRGEASIWFGTAAYKLELYTAATVLIWTADNVSASTPVVYGTGVAAALAINVGTAGSILVNGGVLGTPSSGLVTNLTGTASININGTVGATTANTGAFTTINASGTVAMAGAATVGTTLGVTGTSTMAAINASGQITLASTLLGLTGTVVGSSSVRWIGSNATATGWVINATSGGSILLDVENAAVLTANAAGVTIPGALGVGSDVTLSGSGPILAGGTAAGSWRARNSDGSAQIQFYGPSHATLASKLVLSADGGVSVTGTLGVGGAAVGFGNGYNEITIATGANGSMLYLQGSGPLNHRLYGNGSGISYDASGATEHTFYNNSVNTVSIGSNGSLRSSPPATLGTINLDLYNIAGNESDHIYAIFRLANGTSIGSIRQVSTTSAVVYNTTSDYRIKDLFGSFTTAREMLSALTVHDGQFKGSEHRIPVLVAHEVQTVTPWAVTGEKDAVDDEGLPVYQQMGTGAQEALLIAGWQDHEARLAALQAEFQSYKSSHP